MTTTRMIRSLPGNSICVPQEKAGEACGWISLPNPAQCEFLGLHYIPLNDVIEKGQGPSRLTLQDVFHGLREILFPDQGRETYRHLEGDDMTPITAYKSGNRYIVADDGNRLAAARYLGQSFVLAEVWEPL